MPIATTLRLALVAPLVVAALGAQVSEPVPDPDWRSPLPAVIAVTSPIDMSRQVRLLIALYRADRLPDGVEFPLRPSMGDEVRTAGGLEHQVLLKWLDPLTGDRSLDAPRFGANCDFVAYFGDGWERGGRGPIHHGSGRAGWLWVNHEFIANHPPSLTTAAHGQFRTFARWLAAAGALENDVEAERWTQEDLDTFVAHARRQLGGSWVRIERDRFGGKWRVDRSADNLRYDATDATRLSVTGYRLRHRAVDDAGLEQSEGIVLGLAGDCSGGMTPWGTVITGEETAMDYFGDLESCWTAQNRFRLENGFDPGARIDPVLSMSPGSVFGRRTGSEERLVRDHYGFLVESDPGRPPGEAYRSVAAGGDGRGHRKIGSMGRAQWENCAVVVGRDFGLVDGRPIVLYTGDDRYGGRVYRFVSRGVYRSGMSRGQIRALLDDGRHAVGHFAGLDHATGQTLVATGRPPTEAEPGRGVWIELSVDNDRDVAPNAAALGRPGTTVGAALQDVDYNGIGGFADDGDVKIAVHTAATKLGVAELNRPEDLEYEPRSKRVFVAFTKHTRKVALDGRGVLYPPGRQAAEAPRRADPAGSIWSIREDGPPGSSSTFRFAMVWKGSVPDGPDDDGLFAVANPDNLLIDRHGGLWFGTDGNPGASGDRCADGIYYLDLDPEHRTGPRPTYGRAFRILTAPSDAETTGPALSPDHRTLFVSIQHPGEAFYQYPSTWPQKR